MTPHHTKRRVGSDLFLAAASLLIAFVIWTIAKRGDTTWETYTVPVVMKNIPENIEVKLERKSASVTLSIPTRLRGLVDSASFQLELDFNKERELDDTRHWCGVEDFRPARKVDMDYHHLHLIANHLDKELSQLLENKFQSASISGGDVVVRGKLITRQAKPVFKTTGVLPSTCRLIDVRRADQHTILLTASNKTFEKEGYANQAESILLESEEIDLTAQSKSFKIPVSLRLPPDMEFVNSTDARLEADVRIETSATFDNVPVTLPTSAPGILLDSAPAVVRLDVRGPDDLLDALKPSDFVVRTLPFTTPREGETTPTRVNAFFDENVPKAVTEAVTIVSVKPNTVKVTSKESAPRPPMPRPTPPPERNDGVTSATEGGFSFLVPVTNLTTETLP